MRSSPDIVSLDVTSVVARFENVVARLLAEANASYGDDEFGADLTEATKAVRKRKDARGCRHQYPDPCV